MKYAFIFLFLSVSAFAQDRGHYLLNPEQIEFYELELKLPVLRIQYLPTKLMVRFFNRDGSELDPGPHMMADVSGLGSNLKVECEEVKKLALANGKKMDVTLFTSDSDKTLFGEEDGHCTVSEENRTQN
jgi:hypothetical protein